MSYSRYKINVLLSAWHDELNHQATVAAQHAPKQVKEHAAGGPVPTNRHLVLQDRLKFIKKLQYLIDNEYIDAHIFDKGS